MHDDPCDNHDGAFDTGPREKPTPLPSTGNVTFRVSYMLDAGETQIQRTTFIFPRENMAEALAEWLRYWTSPPLVIACTIADHPSMHTKRRCESVLGGGRCILADGHQRGHEFS
jgi:hypothetical protein